MREVPRYITALIASLQCRDAKQDAIQELSDSDWQELLSFCDAAHLTLFLSKLDADVLPKWVAARVQRNVSDSSLRWERIRATYRELSAALDDAGVEHLVIKGFAQCPAFVGDPRLRMQGDFDIYAPPGSIEGFEEALRRIGYRSQALPRRNGFLAGDHLPAMIRDTKFEWRGNHFDADLPLGVEPHFCFWNRVDTRFGVAGVESFWGRRVVRRLDDLTFTGLHPVDNLGYCALHILRNLFRCEWVIHHVYELACCLHANSGDSAFWRFWRESHDDSLRSFEAISFRLAKMWFNCDLSQEAECEILGLSPAVQQWFVQFSDSPIELMFRANKDGVWLHFALLEKASDKRAVIHHTLFPAMLPSPKGSSQTVTKFKKKVSPWRANGPLRYPTYLISRSTHHLGVLPSALWHGCRWWVSQKGLSPQFWTFFVASVCFNLGLSSFFFLFNIHLVDLGFTEQSIGWLVSAMATGSIVGTLPAGVLASRYGLRRATLTCFGSVIVVFSLRAVVVAVPAHLVLAFAAGAVLSIWGVCISPLVAQLTTERNRPFAFSLIFSSGIGTVALGNIAGGNLPSLLVRISGVGSELAHQMALLLCCGVVALGLRPIWRLRIATVVSPRKRQLPIVHPFLLRFLPAIAMWSLVTGSFMPFANVYFAKHLQMPLPQIGFVFSASQILQVVAVLMAPLVFRRFGLITGIVYMQVATASALASMALFHGVVEASFLYVGYTAFQWMSEPGLYSLLMDKVPPAERSDASAWNVLVSSLSQAVAATLAGAALVRFDYPAVLMMVAGIALLSACVFHVLLRTPGREAACSALTSGMGEVRKPG